MRREVDTHCQSRSCTESSNLAARKRSFDDAPIVDIEPGMMICDPTVEHALQLGIARLRRNPLIAVAAKANAVRRGQEISQLFRISFAVAKYNGRALLREAKDYLGHVAIEAIPEAELVTAVFSKEALSDDSYRQRYRSVALVKGICWLM